MNRGTPPDGPKGRPDQLRGDASRKALFDRLGAGPAKYHSTPQAGAYADAAISAIASALGVEYETVTAHRHKLEAAHTWYVLDERADLKRANEADPSTSRKQAAPSKRREQLVKLERVANRALLYLGTSLGPGRPTPFDGPGPVNEIADDLAAVLGENRLRECLVAVAELSQAAHKASETLTVPSIAETEAMSEAERILAEPGRVAEALRGVEPGNAGDVKLDDWLWRMIAILEEITERRATLTRNFEDNAFSGPLMDFVVLAVEPLGLSPGRATSQALGTRLRRLLRFRNQERSAPQ